jgi:hypothetical protein
MGSRPVFCRLADVDDRRSPVYRIFCRSLESSATIFEISSANYGIDSSICRTCVAPSSIPERIRLPLDMDHVAGGLRGHEDQRNIPSLEAGIYDATVVGIVRYTTISAVYVCFGFLAVTAWRLIFGRQADVPRLIRTSLIARATGLILAFVLFYIGIFLIEP